MKKIFSTPWLKKRDYNPDITSIDDLVLPNIYKQINSSITNSEMKTELKTYKSLGYRFKKESDLNKLEYHSYQIGILLNAIKHNLDLKILNNKDYFHPDVIKLDNRTIEAIVSDIIKKYDKHVDKSLSEIILKKEILFTPHEAGYLLYYLSFYK